MRCWWWTNCFFTSLAFFKDLTSISHPEKPQKSKGFLEWPLRLQISELCSVPGECNYYKELKNFQYPIIKLTIRIYIELWKPKLKWEEKIEQRHSMDSIPWNEFPLHKLFKKLNVLCKYCKLEKNPCEIQSIAEEKERWNCQLGQPYKNMTWIFSRLFDGSLVENDIKSNGNPIIFFANAMEIPWLELV